MPRCTDIPGCGPDGPTSLAEIRTLLGIPVPDYAKVNLDEEEKKYKIQN
jgi:adenylate cyclase